MAFNLNKAIIGTVLFLVVGVADGFSFHLSTLLFGAGYGISLCISMHTGFKALACGPMALTSVIASFSLILPFFAGVFFWNEPITVFGISGIFLLLASIILINTKKESGFSVKWLAYAIATLIANGVCSIIQKLHQMHFPELYRTEFMFWALLCVLVILLVSTGKGKMQFGFSWLAFFSGVMNCLANYIVLYLSATENASVLFPIVSIANIISVWLIGIFFFKERLRPLQAVGLLTGIVSVVLLKI